MDNLDLLKSLLKQILCSLYLGFMEIELYYPDVHLDNFLINFNDTQDFIEYSPEFKVQTYGYEAIIIDFEHAIKGITDNSIFWRTIRDLVSRIPDINAVDVINNSDLLFQNGIILYKNG